MPWLETPDPSVYSLDQLKELYQPNTSYHNLYWFGPHHAYASRRLDELCELIKDPLNTKSLTLDIINLADNIRELEESKAHDKRTTAQLNRLFKLPETHYIITVDEDDINLGKVNDRSVTAESFDALDQFDTRALDGITIKAVKDLRDEDLLRSDFYHEDWRSRLVYYTELLLLTDYVQWDARFASYQRVVNDFHKTWKLEPHLALQLSYGKPNNASFR
jgi:hypothetical protein